MKHEGQTYTQQQIQVRNAWDAIAAGYDEFVTPRHSWLADLALDHLDIQPGMRFLDVAAGSGALSLAGARRGADVLATDISPVMIEHLLHRARHQGFVNLEGRVMDGHALELDDDSFDCSGSQFGVMLFPDLPSGLREMARVTKPGGNVLMVTFGPPQYVEFIGFFLKAAHQVVPGFAGPPMDPPPLPFQVSDPGKLREEMERAGIRDVRVDTATETMEFESAAQLWNGLAHSNPVGAAMAANLSPDQGASVRDVLDRMLAERAGEDRTAKLTSAINIATGVV